MNFEFLSRTFLFQGTSPEETQHMLSCLNAEPKSYPKGSVICQVGDQMKAMGLVLSGSVHIESIDMMGNKTLLNRIAPGQVFGETYACIPGEKLLVGVTAAEDCQILFLEVGKIFRTCPDTCPCHEKLIRNMLMVMAKKKSGAFQTKPSHCAKIHPGKADLLFFPGDGAAGQQSVYYSL